MALLGGFLCPIYRPPNPFSFTSRSRAAGRRFAESATAAVGGRRKRPQNVEGEFFVDHQCIDCDTCRWMAPEVFTRVDGMSAVTRQPSCEEERIKALQALLSCPTSSIHTERPTNKILEVQKMFPLPIDEQNIPGVYHCGYHSERSYGATSYFVTHPEGNILVDSPRFTERLARNIEMLGGVRYMFLTHKLISIEEQELLPIYNNRDDVGDHEKWSKRMRCERIFHSGDVELSTADVENKLCGEGPWDIATDFKLIYTPGHTEGSVCLYYKPLKVLFTGDHLCGSEESDGAFSLA
ncbi:Metallo-beta-lactamase superfamily [Musa troglodytarum]|uniref:Metallo-beta-lactamase superfamily n=1 Tax=Musa troglodytarum TaxID=320322 RepID=A0A9E7FNW5_9LILI|nr:Metallo-beta-lactamase superfamily [Musa troglodytarum]